jgi:hypothetical protein
MKVIRELKRFDMMARPITFNVGGRKGIQTYFGLFMTASYAFTLVTVSYMILLTFLDTTSPQVMQQTSEDSKYPVFDLAKNHILPSFFLALDDATPIPASQVLKYITPRYYKADIETITNPDGTSASTAKLVDMPMVPCEQIWQNETLATHYGFFNETNDYFKSTSVKNGYCAKIVPEALTVYGGGSESKRGITMLDFLPCTLPSGCATLPELKRLSIYLMMPSISLNLSNKAEPIQYYVLKDSGIQINEQMKQLYHYRLSHTEINDDAGFLSKYEKVGSAASLMAPKINSGSRNPAQISCTALDLANRACVTYMRVQIMSSGVNTKINRSYKGVIKTISEIGGINSFTFIFFLYSSYLFGYLNQKSAMARIVFDFLESKKALFDILNSKQQSTELPLEGTNLTEGNPKVISKSIAANQFKQRKKQLEEEAYMVIQNNLDIITIVKEINNLRVLTHLLMKKRHRRLAPLVSIALHTNEKERLKASKNQVQNVRKCSDDMEAFEDHKFGQDHYPEATYQDFVMQMSETAKLNSPLLDKGSNRGQFNVLDHKIDNMYLDIIKQSNFLQPMLACQSSSPVEAQSVWSVSPGKNSQNGDPVLPSSAAKSASAMNLAKPPIGNSQTPSTVRPTPLFSRKSALKSSSRQYPSNAVIKVNNNNPEVINNQIAKENELESTLKDGQRVDPSERMQNISQFSIGNNQIISESMLPDTNKDNSFSIARKGSAGSPSKI